MKLVFSDYSEITHVFRIIKEQWEESPNDFPPRPEYIPPMGTARYLADLLRGELVTEGGASEDDLEDAGEILNWYMPGIEPGMWQYHFAECLASLLIYFWEPLGKPQAGDTWNRLAEINRLESKLVLVMLADHLRHAVREGAGFKEKASALSEHLREIEPAAKDGKEFINRQRESGFRRWEGDQEKHKQWRKWQAEEETIGGRFAELSKQAKAAFLKNKHRIIDAVPTIAKRLTPLPKKRKTEKSCT
jgi:hypothetical protein